MNKVTLTQPQRDILVMLDGRWAPLDLTGNYKRACVSLRDKGLIHFTEGKRFGRKTIRPRLSVDGANFIYNGGIDH
jgi:hypothetical protein